MKVTSAIKLGTVATFATVILAACGNSSSSSQAKDQTLNLMETSALASMDNAKATDIISGETLNNTGEGLLRFGKNSKTLPGLAKTYSKSKDGLTYTFNLRKSVWSNGEKLTAQDFIYAWRRTVDPKTGSQYAYLYGDIKNANAVMAGKKDPSALGVKKAGDYKLVVTLSHPVSYFPTLVAQQCFYPVNKGAVDKYGKNYASNAKTNVYNGPFKLTSWSGTSDNWTLTKNKKYWNAKVVKLQHVKYSAVKDPQTALSQYQSGKLDAITLSGQQPKNYKNNNDFHSRTSSRITYVELNQRKDTMLKNQKARQALSMAIDRKQYVNKVMQDGSKAATGIVSSGLAIRNGKDFASEATVPSATSHNLKKAQSLWKQALKETGRKSYSLTLLADDTPAGKSATEYIQSQWSKLSDFKVTNSNIPYKTRLSRSQNGQFQAVVSGWSADYPDPSTDLSLFTTGNSYNNGRWSNKSYDKLMKAASVTNANKPAARWQNLVDAQKVLLKDQGIIPVYQAGVPQLLKSKVKGVVYFPVGANWDYSRAYIAK
ncbi:ABC-type oligopeptide transport system, periplasmic component [Levilactobacillus senmaizukei DSM 21775 = NBRC 103853]|uniref:ABC-type oligopeptide transport system, periplasmic component n=1 Tax=Levilactobacillus senmaizukei DSM 21775 = NBRC 103853 TaxID=1423803 RepID=A0A0R2DIG4_9LACO|nr:peptide ABC transporter substrate-binding protein [Levilactobacillus senmaizukei]KRN03203.1 ABC-type oligopeptide transport system, periplasmic component [Levilactobacillus senmaizukei DSM 21775 = NBRC 103853]